MYYAHRGMTSRPYKPDRPKLGVLPARLLIIDSALQTLYRRYAMRRNRGRVSRYRASFANAHISEKRRDTYYDAGAYSRRIKLYEYTNTSETPKVEHV